MKDGPREARQVSWPTPQETTRLTGTVIAVCALVSGFLFLLTLGIRAVFQILGVQ
ncbi:MAG: preprotein translocase subunit SecE [Fimbriimonadaceae bacterium]